VKVLFVDHPAPDFLSGVLFKGLCEQLGPESVVDYPWKALYHGRKYESDGVVHAPFPWSAGESASGLHQAWGEEDVVGSVRHFDLVVLMSPRQKSVDALQRIIDCVGRQAIRNLAFVDGEDYTAIRWDVIERFRPDVSFKLSMVPEPFEIYHDEKARVSSWARVVAFPLACPTGEMPRVEKDIDVAFIGGNHWRPARMRREGVPWAGLPEAEYKRMLSDRLAKEFPSFVGSVKEAPVAHVEFMSLLNRSRVAVSVGGFGIEPLRTYEILSCPETMLMREKIPVLSPWPLVEDEHCMMFDTVGGFDHDGIVRGIRRALDAVEERLRIARSGNALLREHYTPHSRAKQLLNEMGLVVA